MSDTIEIRVQGQDMDETVDIIQRDKMKMYYEYTEDYFQKGKHYNLISYKFDKVTSYKVIDNVLHLDMIGEKIYNTQVDCDGELRPVIDEKREKEFFNCWVKVEVYEGNIFRLLAGMDGREASHDTVMLEGATPLVPAQFEVKEVDDNIVIILPECCGIIQKESFEFSILDKEKNVIYRQENNDKVLYFTHESFPLGFVENTELGKKAAVCSSRMEFDENFFGFGEQYSPVNKKMQEVDIFITDPLSVGSPRTYLSLPFYWSTRGYGMYVNTHYRSKFFMGNRSNRSTSCHIYGDDIIDIFYIYGKEPKDILRGYTDITGKSPDVPKWSYGLWMSRCSYKTQEEVMEVANKLREHRIPCDVINIDTDWFEIAWACDWKFGKHNFPEPEKMMKELDEMGLKVSLWQKPYITIEHLPELTAFMEEKGWMPKNKEGEISRGNPVIDLSNPECYDWFKDQLKELMRIGATVIKTDMGEGAPVEGIYQNYSGEEIRNIYTYLYSKAAYEATIEMQGEGLLWGRSSYAGGQKYPLHWAGDPFTDFDGLRYSIRSGLSMGLSGFTYWSHDIGGFLGRPTKEVYVRWAQAGFFCSHARCHGVGNPREPWSFGEEIEDIFRRYDELRYQLIPYIYSQGHTLAKQGLPIMAHLILSNPKDRNCINIDDQWMFGESFLVAPVLSEKNSREVYFPEGGWYDYWTNEYIEGGRFVQVEAPLDVLPLYVKAGSIVPMGPVVSHITSEKDENLTIRVYAKKEGESQFTYYNGQEYTIKACFDGEGVNVEYAGVATVKNIEIISFDGKIQKYEK